MLKDCSSWVESELSLIVDHNSICIVYIIRSMYRIQSFFHSIPVKLLASVAVVLSFGIE